MKIRSNHTTISPSSRRLLKRIVSPLCGLTQRISFMMRGSSDPHFAVAGGELTGVHLLRGQPKPGVNAYHIGGAGGFMDEPIIRTLGESIERYSQLVSEAKFRTQFKMCSYNEILSLGTAVVDCENLLFFSDDQYGSPTFPFDRFTRDAALNWLSAKSLVTGKDIMAPAQLLLVGYVPRRAEGEKWIMSAVTTGTSAHTVPARALRNAILELVQIDGVMGHWYSSAKSSEILLDSRTKAIGRLIDRYFLGSRVMPKFYWIPSPDIAHVKIVACIMNDSKNIPAISIGLGADTSLSQAMYKALLESVSVVQLAKIVLLYQPYNQITKAKSEFLDFDSNVGFYAMSGNNAIIDDKFGSCDGVFASDLPPDLPNGMSIKQQNRELLTQFEKTNKELLFLDLTTQDIAEVGFRTFRVWSPDMISLCLPSIPAKAHPRYQAYGGVVHSMPHPYP